MLLLPGWAANGEVRGSGDLVCRHAQEDIARGQPQLVFAVLLVNPARGHAIVLPPVAASPRVSGMHFLLRSTRGAAARLSTGHPHKSVRHPHGHGAGVAGRAASGRTAQARAGMQGRYRWSIATKYSCRRTGNDASAAQTRTARGCAVREERATSTPRTRHVAP